MVCCLEELKSKEVIDIKTGERLGFIDDVQLDTENSGIKAFMIYGRKRFFGLFGSEDDISVPCENIRVIGREIILIEYSEPSIYTNHGRKKTEISSE